VKEIGTCIPSKIFEFPVKSTSHSVMTVVCGDGGLIKQAWLAVILFQHEGARYKAQLKNGSV
jgi:hypothetical protein